MLKENNSEPVVSSEKTHKVTSVTKNFTERSEIAQEIINQTPDFIEKWALFIFLLLLLLIVIVTWFVKYPDIIQAPAKLTSINSPKQVISLINGKLIKLNVKENEEVQQGKILGFIESTANHYEILKLSALIDSSQKLLNNNSTIMLASIFAKNDFLQLGELQQSFQTLTQAYLNFKNYLPNGFYFKKKLMLFNDISNLQKLLDNLEQQKHLQEEDLSLSQKTFDANESLKKDKIISEFDYRNEQSKLIVKKLSLPLINASIINNESQRNDKYKEIEELKNTNNQQKAIFQQALNTFKSQLEDWKKKYLLIAPIKGKVIFATLIQENQQLQAGQTICFINPENAEYFAQIIIPQTNFGKVILGQDVLLKLASYPFQEYGYVKGKIAYISHIPTDSGYLANVRFSNGLITTYQKRIQYRDGLAANAEIITMDLRLLQRFYYNLVQEMKR